MDKRKEGASDSCRECCDISYKVANLPVEVWIHILSFVDVKTQVCSCRFVCKTWCDLVENESLRKRTAYMNILSKSVHKLPWYVYYAACEENIFSKNLLSNPCGRDKLAGWLIISNGGDRWKVEGSPHGCCPLPEEALSDSGSCQSAESVHCFATSFYQCAKEQFVKLSEHKITSKLMDELQPWIEVSEWFAPRFDCGSVYELTAELLDKNLRVIDSFVFRKEMEAWTDAQWSQAKHIFKHYGPGVKYIRFLHKGNDTQFWKGHYGAKMTLGCVRLHLPDSVSAH